MAGRAARLTREEIIVLLQKQEALEARNAELERQNAGFKRQLFGQKSERRLLPSDSEQLLLAGWGPSPVDSTAPPPPTETVRAYQRRLRGEAGAEMPDERALRFDATVPVEVIAVPNPEVAGLSEAEYEIIGEKVTSRLAQRPGADVILKYVRHVLKRMDTAVLSCPPAPAAVLERSFASVARVAGVSHRAAGYESSRAGDPRHCPRPQKLALLSDGTGSARCRHRAELARVVPPARRRPLCLSR